MNFTWTQTWTGKQTGLMLNVARHPSQLHEANVLLQLVSDGNVSNHGKSVAEPWSQSQSTIARTKAEELHM